MCDRCLNIIINDRFIPKLYYAETNNIANEDLYKKFEISNQILVHSNLACKLLSLVPILKALSYKLIITDAFRPVEIQKYLYDNWESLTGQKPKTSLATIDNAPHPRCIAIDAILANENGEKLNLPSSSIKYNPEQRKPDYTFDKNEDGMEKEKNRNILRTLMICAGISPINKEWFHFQLPDVQSYDIISINDAKNAKIINHIDDDNCIYYDIFDNYWENVTQNNNKFWVFNGNFFKTKKVIDFNTFMEKFCDFYNT